jgi:hypothetical protein
MALLTHYGQWVQPSRRQAPGPAPKPRWMPRPQLRYAQVVKSYRRRRVVRVRHRVVFGTVAGVNRVLEPLGWQINTAFIERANLSIRQHVAAIGRRVITLCKHEAGVRQQLALYHAYYNFLPASCQLTPAPTTARTHAREGFGQAVAALYTRDGGWPERPHVDLARDAPVSGATMAPVAGAVSCWCR